MTAPFPPNAALPPDVQPQPHRQRTGLGILFMIAAVLGFSLMDASAKGLMSKYHLAQLIWVRFLGQLIFTLLILRGASRVLWRTAHPKLHFIRALCQIGAILTFFAALTHIGIAEATAIADINPVLITLGAALFLGESLGPRRLAGVIVALIGALIIIRPGGETFTLWTILPLMNACFYATNALLTRKLGQHEPVWTAMLWGAVLGTFLLGLTLPFVWRPLELVDLPLFIAVGVLGSLGQLFMIKSLSLAEAGAVAPFAYIGIVFATLWGIFFFDQWPDHWTVIGALVIVGAGLYVWHREMSLARRAKP